MSTTSDPHFVSSIRLLSNLFHSIPETKGLSLEQVDELYQNSSILGSDTYRRKLLKAEADLNASRTTGQEPNSIGLMVDGESDEKVELWKKKSATTTKSLFTTLEEL